MKWYIPKTWPKALRVFAIIALVGIIMVTAFLSGAGNPVEGGTRNSKSKSDQYSTRNSTAEAAPPAAPMPMPESPAEYDGGMGSGGYNKDEAPTPTLTGPGALPAERKIIKDGNARIETKEFDKSLAAVDSLIAQTGGFAEARNISGNSMNKSSMRYATIVFRVPAKDFEFIMQSMTSVGTVITSNTSGTDITEQYVDLETRVKNLKIQEQTLQSLMAKAEKIEDVITLESRMSELRYEIESIENQLKNYDRLVQYSRISISLNEVVEVTQIKPVARTLGERAGEAFNDAIDTFVTGLEDFTLWIVANWIGLVCILVLTLAVWIVLRRVFRKKAEKPMEPGEALEKPEKQE